MTFGVIHLQILFCKSPSAVKASSDANGQNFSGNNRQEFCTDLLVNTWAMPGHFGILQARTAH